MSNLMFTAAAVAAMAASSSHASDQGAISETTLAAMGLEGVTVVNDRFAGQVRGFGFGVPGRKLGMPEFRQQGPPGPQGKGDVKGGFDGQQGAGNGGGPGQGNRGGLGGSNASVFGASFANIGSPGNGAGSENGFQASGRRFATGNNFSTAGREIILSQPQPGPGPGGGFSQSIQINVFAGGNASAQAF